VAALPACVVKANQKQLAELRFALAGEDLALLANVTDSRVTQAAEAWRGSCIEVFGSMPGGQEIGQVFLVPQVGEAAAKGFRAANGIVPAADVRVESQAVKGGYVLKALIPLKLLKVDPAKGKFLLEFQMTVDPTADGKKAVRGTLFGSKFAYENNQRYGIFQRQEEKQP